MSKRKHKPAAAPVPESVVQPLPPVAEAATDVQVEQPAEAPCRAELPPEPCQEGEAVWCLPPVCEVIPADRVSAGKLIARQLGMPPAAAQERARLLQDTQIRTILACQLEANAAERIRQILGA
jgi:hypothetical protein